MPQAAAAVAIATIGSLIGGQQQRSAARDQQQYQERIYKEQKAEQEDMMQKAYEGNLENWEKVNKQIDEQIGYLTELAENPGQMSPEFKNLKSQLGEATTATTGRLQDTLRRSGLSGGKQIKVQKDVTEEAQGRLAEALSYISGQAREQIHQANLSRPLKPFYGQDFQSYQPFTPQMPGLPGPVDLSGLGMLAGSLISDQPDEGKQEAESMIQREGTVAQTPYEFYKQLGVFGTPTET